MPEVEWAESLAHQLGPIRAYWPRVMNASNRLSVSGLT
jgi:hypothetical protein